MSAHPATLREFFEPAQIKSDRLGRAVLKKAGRPAQAIGRNRREVAIVLKEPVMDALWGALDISFADILSRGWLALNELRHAAQLSANGRPYAVPVGRHRLRSEHRPALEVTHDDAAVASLKALAIIEIRIESIEIIVREGAVSALRNGHYIGAGALQIEGVGIASMEQRAFTLEGEARLRKPLPVPF